MNPSVSDRIGRIINPSPHNDASAVASSHEPPVEPLQSVPVLIGWMLGPPSPMPRARAVVEVEVQVITPTAAEAGPPGMHG